MADFAVFASGTGSNFRKLHQAFTTGPHRLVALVTDRKSCAAAEYARAEQIPVLYHPYPGRSRDEVEAGILTSLAEYKPDFLVLAGFMRLLGTTLLEPYEGRIINIHPSLLPAHPGTGSIQRSWESGDEYLGITIHYVDSGMDTGPVLVQQAFHRSEVSGLSGAEERIHQLEHFWYPETLKALLDSHDAHRAPSGDLKGGRQ